MKNLLGLSLSAMLGFGSACYYLEPVEARNQVTEESYGDALESAVIFHASNVRYSVIISQDNEGNLNYSGQSKAGIITLTARETRYGFVASNGQYLYQVEITGRRAVLTIFKNGRRIDQSVMTVHP